MSNVQVEAKSEKKSYARPQLVKVGGVETLTQTSNYNDCGPSQIVYK
ncbi:MAG TPA: hypothetical protein VHD56_00485 [Tepidisphaeraceae bacterium]|nr:hypothetical protein [Tepidisphaeraceae bacterium]